MPINILAPYSRPAEMSTGALSDKFAAVAAVQSETQDAKVSFKEVFSGERDFVRKLSQCMSNACSGTLHSSTRLLSRADVMRSLGSRLPSVRLRNKAILPFCSCYLYIRRFNALLCNTTIECPSYPVLTIAVCRPWRQRLACCSMRLGRPTLNLPFIRRLHLSRLIMIDSTLPPAECLACMKLSIEMRRSDQRACRYMALP